MEWDMSLFQGIVYPDNEKRAARVIQLVNDHALALHNLKNHRTALDGVFADLGLTQAEVARKLSIPASAMARSAVDEKWTVKIPEFAGKFIMKKAVVHALRAASGALAWEQGMARTSSMVALPRFLAASEFGRSMTAALAADLIVSIVKGNNEKASLEQAIRQMVPVRAENVKASLIADAISSSMNALSLALQMNESTFADIASDKREKFFRSIVDEGLRRADAEVERWTNEAVGAHLRALDERRQAYTADDV